MAASPVRRPRQAQPYGYSEQRGGSPLRGNLTLENDGQSDTKGRIATLSAGPVMSSRSAGRRPAEPKITRETFVKREASAVTCAVTIGKCPGNRRMGDK